MPPQPKRMKKKIRGLRWEEGRHFDPFWQMCAGVGVLRFSSGITKIIIRCNKNENVERSYPKKNGILNAMHIFFWQNISWMFPNLWNVCWWRMKTWIVKSIASLKKTWIHIYLLNLSGHPFSLPFFFGIDRVVPPTREGESGRKPPHPPLSGSHTPPFVMHRCPNPIPNLT